MSKVIEIGFTNDDHYLMITTVTNVDLQKYTNEGLILNILEEERKYTPAQILFIMSKRPFMYILDKGNIQTIHKKAKWHLSMYVFNRIKPRFICPDMA